jgi:hypothetical protein
MNIVIKRFEDNFYDGDRPFLCIRFFNNAIKLSVETFTNSCSAFSEGNMACFEIKNVCSIDRYNVYNEMLFYAGSIVRRLHNNGDCDNVCLDWISFCNFATKINLWLANH